MAKTTEHSIIKHWLLQYLTDLSNSRSTFRKREGKLTASMAGRCYEMHYYQINGYDKKDMDFNGLYNTHIGTVIHRTVQNAIANQQQNITIQDFRIELPEYNVMGELDLALIDIKKKQIKLYDFKVLGNYSWKKKTKSKEPSLNYELQVGTYVAGLRRLFKDYEINPFLIWIKRETGVIKSYKVPQDAEEKATKYWKEVNRYLEERAGKPIIGEYPTPIESWECKYCPFSHHCIGE